MLTSADFQRAFALLLEAPSKKVNNGFSMLKANYRSPARTISAARLAQAAGYASYSTGNEQYGSFAHQIADLLSYEPSEKVDGETRWTYTICEASDETDKHGHFQWKLRAEVADALEKLKLVKQVDFPDAFADIEAAKERLADLPAKSREAVIQSRLGQGIFRDRLIKQWGRCAVTGCDHLDLLIASHIKPWRCCSVTEAVDMPNGLLLVPNLDRAFDRGFITFGESGEIILSPQLSPAIALQLGIQSSMQLSKIFDQHRPYLEYHRANVFRSTS